MSELKQLILPGCYVNIKPICAFVVQAAESAGLNEDAVFHVQLAVDEACSNIIEHAYGGEGKGDIEVICDTRDEQDGHFFVVQIRDQGQPFNPDNVPKIGSNKELDQLQVGGLGLHFMRQTMDRIEFHFHSGYNTVMMFKRLAEERHPLDTSPLWHQPFEHNTWLIDLRGRLDHELTPLMESTLSQFLATGRNRLVIDLSEVSYINSGGLRALVSVWRDALQRGGDVQLSGLGERLKEILGMAGFERIFPFHATPADAALAINARSDD